MRGRQVDSTAAADPRVRAAIIHSSGIFSPGKAPNSEMDIGKASLFRDPNGGREASVAVSWLDWQRCSLYAQRGLESGRLAYTSVW
jgi:hypothetical protein